MLEERKHPTFGNGKICHIEIPSLDPKTSAEFYQIVFGWHIRANSDGCFSFDEGVREVSGMWVTGREPVAASGLVLSIMVRSIPETLELIRAHGGKFYQTASELSSKTILFSDPSGNIFCLYQSDHA